MSWTAWLCSCWRTTLESYCVLFESSVCWTNKTSGILKSRNSVTLCIIWFYLFNILYCHSYFPFSIWYYRSYIPVNVWYYHSCVPSIFDITTNLITSTMSCFSEYLVLPQLYLQCYVQFSSSYYLSYSIQ